MRYNPIFVVSTGRSGSSMLMRLFSFHPQILVRSVFPYESRAFQNYYLASRNGLSHADFSPIEFKGNSYHPFQGNDAEARAWSVANADNTLGENGSVLTAAYYDFIAERDNKSNAVFFAEKAIGSDLVMEIKAKLSTEIVLLGRDPRDIFFSVKSFNKKRGFLSFGEERGDENLLLQIINQQKYARKLFVGDSRAIAVKYEDLILNKKKTLKHMFGSFSINNDDVIIDAVIASAAQSDKSVQAHKTAHSDEESIGRWRSNIDETYQELFGKYQTLIGEIGYE